MKNRIFFVLFFLAFVGSICLFFTEGRVFIIYLIGTSVLVSILLIALSLAKRADRKRDEENAAEREKIRLRRERINRVFTQSREEGWNLITLYKNLIAAGNNVKPEEVTGDYVGKKREKDIYPDARFFS